MKRRNFITSLLAVGASRTLAPSSASAAPDTGVKRVLVMFKCHLDVGFVDTQANVIRKYFDVYFPQAIQTAAAIRKTGKDRYIWTTGSWLVYEYLQKAAPARRQQMERAIA